MLPNLAPMCVGSFPHIDADDLCEKLVDRLAEVPLWPQLPMRSFFEGMYVQYSEGMPMAVLEEEQKKIHFHYDSARESELEAFYQQFLENNLSSFSISESHAEGLYRFAEKKEQIAAMKPRWIKGQSTGPVSFGLSVTDEARKPILFDPRLKEILLIGLKMRAKWQIDFLKRIYDDVIFFVDEPFLASIGSGIISLRPDEVFADLDDMFAELRSTGALLGLHCCGNTDWSMMMNMDLDILNFDAFNYGENFLIYEKELRAFIERGGLLAWGIVPTTQDSLNTPLDALVEKMEHFFGELIMKGFSPKLLAERSFVTPSCGMATIGIADSEMVLDKVIELSRMLKEKYSV
jgi:hypothetical protein